MLYYSSIVFLLFFFSHNKSFCQKNQNNNFINKKNELTNIFIPSWNDYFFTKNNNFEKKIFDSSVTVKKIFKNHNFFKKDLFGKINYLIYRNDIDNLVYSIPDFEVNIIPDHKIDYLTSIKNIYYFNVKTPTTKLVYNHRSKIGTSINTLFTNNINPKWNYSIQFNRFESKNKKINIDINNSIIITSNFQSKNENFKVETHYVISNFYNKKNNIFFDKKEEIPDYLLFKFLYKRFFIDLYHKSLYLNNFFKKKSIEFYNLTFYEFINSNSRLENNINNNFNKITNISIIQLDKLNNIFSINFKLKFDHLNLEKNLLTQSLNLKNEKFSDKIFSLNTFFNFNFNSKLYFLTDIKLSKSNYLKENLIMNSSIKYSIKENYPILFNIKIKSFCPIYKFITHELFFSKKDSLINLKNENLTQLSLTLYNEKYLTKFKIKKTIINNYTFLNNENIDQILYPSLITQLYFKNNIYYEKFGLYSEVIYQILDKKLFMTQFPKIISRITLYYNSLIFKNKIKYFTGLNLYYVSKFDLKSIINKFYLNNEHNQLIFNLFLDMKINNIFFFIEAKNININFIKRRNVYNKYINFDLNLGFNWFLFN